MLYGIQRPREAPQVLVKHWYLGHVLMAAPAVQPSQAHSPTFEAATCRQFGSSRLSSETGGRV